MTTKAPSGGRKVIITCAVTGAIHIPSQTPYLPITPDEIAESALGAAEAGAAILHLHARDPKTASPTPDPEMFMRVPAADQEPDERGDQHHHRRRPGHDRCEERLAAPLRIASRRCARSTWAR